MNTEQNDTQQNDTQKNSVWHSGTQQNECVKMGFIQKHFYSHDVHRPTEINCAEFRYAECFPE